MHRRLLEDRVDELKVGAVLLLKQVRLSAIVSFIFFFSVLSSISAQTKCSMDSNPTSLLPLWSGGRVFPLPSKPLPECDAQQPAEDLRP